MSLGGRETALEGQPFTGQGQLPGGEKLTLREKAKEKCFLSTSSALGVAGKRQ